MLQPPPSLDAYLRGPLRADLAAAWLVCGWAYSERSATLGPFVIALLGAFLALAWRGGPRWAGHLALAAALAISSAARLSDAGGPRDVASDRDECAERVAERLLAGEVPWEGPQGNCNTNGPASVLTLAAGRALGRDHTDLALIFWLLALGLLLAGDLRLRNSSLPLTAPLAGAGMLWIEHTQIFELEELYFGLLLYPLAFAAARRRAWGTVGASLAAAVLWRANYVFPSLAFLAWLCERGRLSRADALRLALGTAALAVACVGVVAAVDPSGFAAREPLAQAAREAVGLSPNLSLAARMTPQAVPHALGAGAAAALALSAGLAALGLAAWWLRRLGLRHPFVHLAAAGAAAHLVFWTPVEWRDYMLMPLLPALWALAFRSGAAPPGAPEAGC